MSNVGEVPEQLVVGRSDAAYMAHAYLTKVPVPAIMPFLEAYTEPGDVVADPFAGSGMTGVAAAMLGRSARLFDISVLGKHIGKNYANLLDPEIVAKQAQELISSSLEHLGDAYRTKCHNCGNDGRLAKTVWSIIVECSNCESHVNYYNSLEAANWHKPSMACPACEHRISSRMRRVDEEPVLDYINCDCSSKQLEQPPEDAEPIDLGNLEPPAVEITPDRQMYKASALGKSGMTSISSFYSPRNLAVLTSLRQKIGLIGDSPLRSKMLFAFTACLTRASKRYQWSKARPLNAANANYYVAPVFYEWNVYDLFSRKVDSLIRSDEWIRSSRRVFTTPDDWDTADVSYDIGSADCIALPDKSVDYVFTDPPFGANLFYADMALFQEAWLGEFTDVQAEAVIDRTRDGSRSAGRYEEMLTGSLSECRRILKNNGKISMVFGNSSGKVWALVQRAISNARLRIVPERLVVLNKGQRSVKGLASGFEDVATLDLIITMEKSDEEIRDLQHLTPETMAEKIRHLANKNPASPSHLYLELLRAGVREGWRLDELDLRVVTDALKKDGWDVDPKTGRIHKFR